MTPLQSVTVNAPSQPQVVYLESYLLDFSIESRSDNELKDLIIGLKDHINIDFL